VYTERLDNGDFALFEEDFGTGFSRNVLAHPWLFGTEFNVWGAVSTQWFPEE
jgi:hypothetical protein